MILEKSLEIPGIHGVQKQWQRINSAGPEIQDFVIWFLWSLLQRNMAVISRKVGKRLSLVIMWDSIDPLLRSSITLRYWFQSLVVYVIKVNFVMNYQVYLGKCFFVSWQKAFLVPRTIQHFEGTNFFSIKFIFAKNKASTCDNGFIFT